MKELTKDQITANKMVKVTAILSIVFGSLGALFGLLVMILGPTDMSADVASLGGAVVFGIIIFLLWVAPHVFLIISGINLLYFPKKSVAQGLIITTLVIGAIWNLILLVFAIINLTQLQHYTGKHDKLQT